ncbi:hypothetical protein MMC15_003602 [Xylographa vitiligo]|nr:hypothetical protein [Xylographa vitiligo]
MSTPSSAMSTSSTAVPTSSTAVPTSSTAVPTSSTAVPTSSTAVPTSSTAVPTSSTAVPTSSTAVPTSSTAVPTSLTAVPTTFASLTKELITQIVSNLEPGRGMRVSLANTRTSLPLYATISKKFQYAVEYRTFNSIELDSDELGYFAKIFMGHRRFFLATLKYRPILAEYDPDEYTEDEELNDIHYNNQMFTDAILGLYQVLKSWEDEDENTAVEEGTITNSRPIELYLLEPRSPTDSDCFLHRRSIPALSLGIHRFEHSFLQLLDPEDLPDLTRILHFSAHVSFIRRVEPRSLVTITASLIGLKTIDWRLSDEEKVFELTAQNNRFELARVLPRLPTESLTSFRLMYERQAPIDHQYRPPSVLLPASPATDYLCLALHRLSQSQNLTELTLSGPFVISAALFWPAPANATLAPAPAAGLPFWPNMQKFVVEFSPVAPDGSWCFLREELHGAARDAQVLRMQLATRREVERHWTAPNDCYNALAQRQQVGAFPAREFRRVPDGAHIPGLMLALARAATRMPRLRRLHVDVAPRLPFAFGVRYVAAGEAYQPFYDTGNTRTVHRRTTAPADDVGLPRLYWTVRGWRPEEEVLELWRGREEDQKLLVKYYAERAATAEESANGGPVVVGEWGDE